MTTLQRSWSWLAEAFHWLLLGGAYCIPFTLRLGTAYLHKPHWEDSERTLTLIYSSSSRCARDRTLWSVQEIDMQFRQLVGALENVLPARLLRGKEVDIEALRLYERLSAQSRSCLRGRSKQSPTISQEIRMHMSKRRDVILKWSLLRT